MRKHSASLSPCLPNFHSLIMQLSNFLLFASPMGHGSHQVPSRAGSCGWSRWESPAEPCLQHPLARSDVMPGCAHQQSTRGSNRASGFSRGRGLGRARGKPQQMKEGQQETRDVPRQPGSFATSSTSGFTERCKELRSKQLQNSLP